MPWGRASLTFDPAELTSPKHRALARVSDQAPSLPVAVSSGPGNLDSNSSARADARCPLRWSACPSQRWCFKKPLEKKVISSVLQYSLDAIMAFYKVIYNASCSCKKIYYSDPERHKNPCKVQVFLLKSGLVLANLCLASFLGDSGLH